MLSEMAPLTLALVVTLGAIVFRVYMGTANKERADLKVRPIIQTAVVSFIASITTVLISFESITPGLADSAFLPIVIGQFVAVVGSDAALRSIGKKITKPAV